MKHFRENGYTHVLEKDFQILGNKYKSHLKQKISVFAHMAIKTCIKFKWKVNYVKPFSLIYSHYLERSFIPLICSSSLLSTVQLLWTACFNFIFKGLLILILCLHWILCFYLMMLDGFLAKYCFYLKFLNYK